MTLPYTASDDPGWDAMRAGEWDVRDYDGNPVTSLPVVLGLIGAGNKPPAEQRRILSAWAASAAYRPAPEELKAQVRAFLTGSAGGGEAGG